MCLIFGIPSVEEAKQRISDEQFWEWMALDQVDPLPDPWMEHARLCQFIEAVATGKSQKLADYFPNVDSSASKLGSIEAHHSQSAANAGRQR